LLSPAAGDHSMRAGSSTDFATANACRMAPTTGTSARISQRATPPASAVMRSTPGISSTKFFKSLKNSRAASALVLHSTCSLKAALS
jgi:hypothetical protein